MVKQNNEFVFKIKVYFLIFENVAKYSFAFYNVSKDICARFFDDFKPIA